MFCRNCGNQVQNQAQFCPKCGEKLNFPQAAPASIPDSPPRKKKPPVAAAVVIIIAVVITGGLFTDWFGLNTDKGLTDSDIDEVHAAESEIEAAVNPNDEISKQFEDAVNAVKQQQDQGLVENYSVSISGVEVRYVCGITYIFTPDYSELDLLSSGQGEADISQYAVSAGYGSKKALFIKTPDIKYTGLPQAYESLKDTGNFYCDTWADENVTLAFLKTAFKDTDIVVWGGHGGLSSSCGPFLMTGEKKSSRSASKKELTSGQVIETNKYYAVTGRFFEENYESDDLNGTFLYFESCNVGEEGHLVDALLSRGAAAIAAFDYTVTQDYSSKITATFFEELVKKTSEGYYIFGIGQAKKSAQEKYGTEDYGWGDYIVSVFAPISGVRARARGAELKIFGDKSYMLFSPTIYSDENIDSNDVSENDVSEAEEPEISYMPPIDEEVYSGSYTGSFAIEGKWKQTGENTFGQAGKGAIVVFDGVHCNWYSPQDTYAFYEDGGRYRLDITSLLFAENRTYNVTVVDSDHIEIGSGPVSLKRVG